MKKKKWKQIFCRMLAIIMSVLMMPTSVFAQISVDSAKKITANWWPKKNEKQFSSFDDSKALKVKGSYGFRLYKTKKTTFTVEEGKSCKYPTSYNGLDLNIKDFQKDYLWFKTSENSVNKIKVKISNMQIYQCNDDGSNGHWIKVDMVRTVSGIEKYKGQDGYIALGEGVTNTVYIGLEEVKTTSTFYKAGTTTKVSLKSNVTLKDIDSHQYIGVKASKVDGQYVSSNTKLSYKEDNGTYIYYANYDDDYDSQDFTCAAFIFEGNSFEYTFGRNLDQPTRRDQFVGSGQNMIKFNTVPPTKSVTDNNETKVTSNTVEHFGQDWTYNVEQVIPTGIPTAHRYTKFEFEDEIESCMKINSVKVVASKMESTKDATSWFDIKTNGNKVTATLKDPKGNASFYNYGIYTLKVNVSLNIPENATQEQMAALKKIWKEHGHYDETKNVVTENNTAKTTIDSKTSTTNQVTTTVEGPKKTVSDADETTTKNIIITNTHTPETTQKKVKKIWNDNGNKDGIRPKSVTVNLLADGKVEESFTLSAENNWQAKSKLLPVKVNGKKVNYTWEEVKEGLITGESEIGYKPSYDTDATDQDLTLITNFHDRTEPKGSVTITKALDPGNLNMDVGDPSFTFTLSGMDVYGKKHSYEKQIKFTKAEVEKQMKDHPGDPIELSVTFDDLEYGTYTCDEGGMLKYFKLKSLTSDSSNAIVDQKKGTVTFEIGPTGMTAKAQLKGTAKFTNQMIQGSIKLVKKDSNGRALKDVEFEIHSSDGAQVAKAKTDAAGEITFDGLIPDTYTITETKTKEGKTLLKEAITATIPLTMSQAEVDKQKVDTSKAIKDGNTYYFYHMTYEVTNDARLDLPKTGGWTDYLPLAGGMILILGGLFVYYRKKKGDLKEEL